MTLNVPRSTFKGGFNFVTSSCFIPLLKISDRSGDQYEFWGKSKSLEKETFIELAKQKVCLLI